MSQPLSNEPDSGIFRGARRRFQPGEVQLALQRAKRAAQRHSRNLWQQGGTLLRRGRRHPRVLAAVAAGVAVTLIGAYTVSASGVGPSLCPAAQRSAPVSKTLKKSDFQLLMDQVPQTTAAGSDLEIYYDVCGLPKGTRYSGRVVVQQSAPPRSRKAPAKPKPIALAFKDEVDGPATRRRQEIGLKAARPGSYTVELTVADNQGHERKRVQKIRVK
jgi:hypothetical protein